jgi:uncharacterized protein
MSEDLLHQTHPEVVKRFRRAEGHLRSTITMFEVGRPCVELAQQLHAVDKAIAEAHPRPRQNQRRLCLITMATPTLFGERSLLLQWDRTMPPCCQAARAVPPSPPAGVLVASLPPRPDAPLDRHRHRRPWKPQLERPPF